MIGPSQHYQPPPDYEFGQPINSSPNRSSIISKVLIFVGIVIIVIVVIISFFALLRGDGPKDIDTLLIRQQNLLAIAEAAETENEDFDTEQIIVNAIILMKSDIADLQSYRDSEFEDQIDEDLETLMKDREDLEGEFSKAKQLDKVPDTFYKLFGEELGLSINLLENFDAEPKKLESIIQRSLSNQKTLQDAIEPAQAGKPRPPLAGLAK